MSLGHWHQFQSEVCCCFGHYPFQTSKKIIRRCKIQLSNFLARKIFKTSKVEDVLFDYIEGYAKQPSPSLYQTILLYCFSMELGLRCVEHHRRFGKLRQMRSHRPETPWYQFSSRCLLWSLQIHGGLDGALQVGLDCRTVRVTALGLKRRIRNEKSKIPEWSPSRGQPLYAWLWCQGVSDKLILSQEGFLRAREHASITGYIAWLCIFLLTITLVRSFFVDWSLWIDGVL
jgi:hypothetical protein